MRILVFGAGGQVGHALSRLRAPAVEIAAVGRAEADLTDAGVHLTITEIPAKHPDVLVQGVPRSGLGLVGPEQSDEMFPRASAR